MKKKHWNWFEDEDGNLITNNMRYSLLETDSNGNLISVAPVNELPTYFVEKEMTIDEAKKRYSLSWWQRIIAYLKQLWKDM